MGKKEIIYFSLPPYSPHLNIIERLWKEMKARWIQTKDYETHDQLCYATTLILNAIGKNQFLNFKQIN